MSKLYIVVIIIAGLALGSFINAYVWRAYKQSTSKTKKTRQAYSILRGRSMCPNCRHVLAALDLAPIFSWLFLKGKCRYCHKPISAQYPLVEIITTGLFVLSYIYWPLKFNNEGICFFIIWLILLVSLISLAVYDIRWMTLPNRIVYPLFGLVALQIVVTVIFFNGRGHYILDDCLGLIIGGGVFFILFQLSSGKWIGGGDVKLGAVLGLYLGNATDAVLMIFFASLIGSLYSIPLMATGKLSRKALIPYGPFLIAATIILRLVGGSITSWLNTKGLVI